MQMRIMKAMMTMTINNDDNADDNNDKKKVIT